MMKFDQLDRKAFGEGFDAALTGSSPWLLGENSAAGYGYSFGVRLIRKLRPDFRPGNQFWMSGKEIILALTSVISGDEILLDSPAEAAAQKNAIDAEFTDIADQLPQTADITSELAEIARRNMHLTATPPKGCWTGHRFVCLPIDKQK